MRALFLLAALCVPGVSGAQIINPGSADTANLAVQVLAIPVTQ